MASEAALATVPSGERLHLVDALRGFALLGVFLINIGDFALYWAVPLQERTALPLGWTARLAEVVSLVFVRAKFYTIFSFLFGLGFALLLQGAMRTGAGVDRVYRRRLAALLVIGTLHMTLIWWGDILSVYALLGFALPLFARAGDRTLLLWAGVMYALPAVLRTAVVLSAGALDPGGPLRAAGESFERMLLGPLTESDYRALLLSGDWGLLLKYNLSGPLLRYADLLSTNRFPRVFGAFLLGLWAGRHGVFQDPAAHRTLLWRVVAWGLPIGLVLNGALAALAAPSRALDDPLRIAEEAASIGVAPLALAYVAAFTLLWLSPRWQRPLAVLAPAGRMALTNYLAQSFIGIFLFYGVGLGLGGRVSAAACAGIAVAVFTAQAWVSALWLGRFRFGPAEWLWRSAAYRAWQPIRRTPARGSRDA